MEALCHLLGISLMIEREEAVKQLLDELLVGGGAVREEDADAPPAQPPPQETHDEGERDEQGDHDSEGKGGVPGHAQGAGSGREGWGWW